MLVRRKLAKQYVKFFSGQVIFGSISSGLRRRCGIYHGLNINRALKDPDYHLSLVDEVELALFGEFTAYAPSLSKDSCILVYRTSWEKITEHD